MKRSHEWIQRARKTTDMATTDDSTKPDDSHPFAPTAGYVAGQKVRAKVACHNGLSEDGMGGYYCHPGEVLVVRAVGNRNSNHYNWDLWVSHESVEDSSFGVNDYEVEPHNT